MAIYQMITITIHEADQPLYVARIGKITHNGQTPSRWFGELLQAEGSRVGYAEAVTYNDDPLHVASMLLSMLKADVQLSTLR